MKQFVKIVTLILLAAISTQGFCDTKSKQPKKVEQKTAVAPPIIEIKGITIGMPMSEYKAIIANNGDSSFSIGGVTAKSPMPPLFDHRDGKLDNFAFMFKPEGFTSILDAVKGKYPSISCINSEIQNRIGASFSQVECVLDGTDSVLRISKYAGDITTSILMLQSKQRIQEGVEKLTKGRSDV